MCVYVSMCVCEYVVTPVLVCVVIQEQRDDRGSVCSYVPPAVVSGVHPWRV